MNVPDGPLRILFASPAWWPAVAFGGPIWIGRELTERLAGRGHEVQVLTTTLVDLDRPGATRSRDDVVAGVKVRYLATPLRYRWMGISPGLPVELRRLERPDVVHVFGFRDVITTGVATWARASRIPYVFEPLGMFRPRLRKVRFKRVFDATVARGVTAGAAAVVVSSSVERDDVLGSGLSGERIRVRGCGFPEPFESARKGRLRRELGISADAPVILYVGRIAAGKGIELLLDAARDLPEAHLVLAGPDDRHGTIDRVRAAQADAATRSRVHVFQPGERPLWIYSEADVLALPSTGESFGMVASEAAAAGTPVVLSDRCGVADFFEEGEAVVVPYDGPALTDALRRVLGDAALRRRLSDGGREAARRTSWDRIADRQEQLYREALAASRTAATRFSTLGS